MPVRFGILGFGLHAVRRLMPGFRLAQNAQVTALSRRNLEKARASAQEYAIPLAFGSAAELCQCKDVDAIFVTTPNACHREDVVLALECGKHVLCEKPMALNAAECREMIAAARRRNRVLGVAQIFRFEESTNRLRQRLHAGEIGRPVFASAEFSYWGRGHARSWINDLAISGGGPIADVGVHCIDTLRFILDDEVVWVQASGASDSESGEVECAAILNLGFAKGTLGSVMVSTRAHYRTPLEFVGEAGVLFVDDGLSVDHAIRLELRREGRVAETEQLSNHLAYARQVDAFAAAVEGKAEFPVPGEEGLRNQLVLDAAYQSLKSGSRESIGIPAL